MRDRLAVGEGQHILIGIDQQERLQHHAVDHRLMNTEREQEVTEAVDENRPGQTGVDQPQRLLNKCRNEMDQIRVQHVRQYGRQHRKQGEREDRRDQRGKGFTHRWRYVLPERNVQRLQP